MIIKILFFSCFSVVLCACVRDDDKVEGAVYSVLLGTRNPALVVDLIDSNWAEAELIFSDSDLVDLEEQYGVPDLGAAIASAAFEYREWSLVVKYGSRSFAQYDHCYVCDLLAFSYLITGDFGGFEVFLDDLSEKRRGVSKNYALIRNWILVGDYNQSLFEDLDLRIESGIHALVLALVSIQASNLPVSHKSAFTSKIEVLLNEHYFENELYISLVGVGHVQVLRDWVSEVVKGTK